MPRQLCGKKIILLKSHHHEDPGSSWLHPTLNLCLLDSPQVFQEKLCRTTGWGGCLQKEVAVLW